VVAAVYRGPVEVMGLRPRIERDREDADDETERAGELGRRPAGPPPAIARARSTE